MRKIIKSIICFIIFFHYCSLCFSLPLKIDWTWSHRYGIQSANNIYQFPNSVQQTSDGGYIIASHINWGHLDCLIIKINASGIIEWQKALGDPKGSNYLMKIIQAYDGGYIAAGGTEYLGAYKDDGWIIKLNAFGDIIWQKAYGDGNYGYFREIQQTSDGGYIATGGSSSNNAWIVKLNSSGNIVWQKAYGNIDMYSYWSIKQTNDGGYIAVGWTRYFDPNLDDIWIVKLDSSGNIIWQKIFGTPAGDEYAYSIIQDSDGNYVIAGQFLLWILKLDLLGNVIWQKQYSAGEGEEANKIQETSDKAYIILGDNLFEILVVKIDFSGNIIWQKKYNSGEVQFHTDLALTGDGGFVVTGVWPNEYYSDDIWLIKTNKFGELDSSCNFFVSDAQLIASDTSLNSFDAAAIATPTFVMVKDTTSASIDYSAADNLICQRSDIPVLISHKPEIDDSGSSTHNGIIEENESVKLIGNLENISELTATSVTGLLTSLDPINIINPNAIYPDIIGGTNQSTLIPYQLIAHGVNRPSTHWDFTVSEQPLCISCIPFIYDFRYHVGNSFLDVPPQNIFYSYIEKILHADIISGCRSRYYCPLSNVTREQMAKFVCNAAHNGYGTCVTDACQHLFNDVPDTNLFCPYIEKLYADSVIDGCQAQPLSYCPLNPVNRQEMAKFICNGMSFETSLICNVVYCGGTFADVPTSNPFCGFIESLYSLGIINGCRSSPLFYCPYNNVTREQMSKFIDNAFGFQF